METALRNAHSDLPATIDLDEQQWRALRRFLRGSSLGGAEYWAEHQPLPPIDLPETIVEIRMPADWRAENHEIWLSAYENDRAMARWLAAPLEPGETIAQVHGVPLVEGWRYLAQANDGPQTFRSEFVSNEELAANSSLSLYPLSENGQLLRQETLVLQFQMPGPPENDGALLVTQALRLSNASEYLVAESLTKSWQMPLPPGAERWGLAAPERYGLEAETRAIFGRQPLLPGARELVISRYHLPLNALAVYEFRFPYGLEGPLRILLPDGWSILGAEMPSLGKETINEQDYQSYGVEASYEPGHVLRFGLREGNAPAAAAAPGTLVVFLAMALALLPLAGLWYRQMARRQ